MTLMHKCRYVKGEVECLHPTEEHTEEFREKCIVYQAFKSGWVDGYDGYYPSGNPFFEDHIHARRAERDTDDDPAEEVMIPLAAKSKACILDACCGSRMFWWERNRDDVIYMDNRDLECTLCDGRTLKIHPDIVADFRDMPFEDERFNMVVFDPPHYKKNGRSSRMGKKYGVLSPNWKEDIRQGFSECLRVTRAGGFVIFKWSLGEFSAADVVRAIGVTPLFGQRCGRSVWLVFMKEV